MFIDTHCHITSEDYDNISLIIEKIKSAGVNKIIVNGTDMKSNLEVLDLVKKYDIVYGAIGFHPTELEDFQESSLLWLEEHINDEKIVALGEVGLDYHNQLEWLIRTDTRYIGDRFYVKRFTEADEKHCVVIDEPSYEERALSYCKRVLDVICSGNDVQTENYLIDDSNRKQFYHLLMTLYRSEYEAKRKKELANKKVAPRGRQRIKIDILKSDEIFNLFTNEKISEAEALKRLGVSRATFYRRLKEFRNLA